MPSGTIPELCSDIAMHTAYTTRAMLALNLILRSAPVVWLSHLLGLCGKAVL
jgi:hypothetical protein